MKSEESYVCEEAVQTSPLVFEVNKDIGIPEYLNETYWWAYLHPRGVKFFDSTWMVNSILFGNYKKLRDKVLDDLDEDTGNILQLAAVYGNISPKIAEKITAKNRLDVVDVAAIQLQNLSKKINGFNNIQLIHQDASQLTLKPQSYEVVLIFFLLHEVPDDQKQQILDQALKMVKPGGKIVLVDYHKPKAWSPCRYLMYPVLTWLEPFAMSMWNKEIISWLPKDCKVRKVTKETVFMGLYQKVVSEM